MGALGVKEAFYPSPAAVNLRGRSQVLLLRGNLNLNKTVLIFLGGWKSMNYPRLQGHAVFTSPAAGEARN